MKVTMGSLTWEHLEEFELVQFAQNGNLAAFDTLAARYRPGALVLSKQILSDREAAQDAVQDSFLAAFKALPQLSDAEKFAGWFGAIVRHRSRRLAAGVRYKHLPIDDVIIHHSPSIVTELERNTDSEIVRIAISSISEDVRPIVELYYLEEWNVGQIADFLWLPKTTVKWRLHSGRSQLKGTLADRLEESNGTGK